MTTGPPPKITVPARYMLLNRERGNGGEVRRARMVRIVMNEARYRYQ
jgi:hypothetical protein